MLSLWPTLGKTHTNPSQQLTRDPSFSWSRRDLSRITVVQDALFIWGSNVESLLTPKLPQILCVSTRTGLRAQWIYVHLCLVIRDLGQGGFHPSRMTSLTLRNKGPEGPDPTEPQPKIPGGWPSASPPHTGPPPAAPFSYNSKDHKIPSVLLNSSVLYMLFQWFFFKLKIWVLPASFLVHVLVVLLFSTDLSSFSL